MEEQLRTEISVKDIFDGIGNYYHYLIKKWKVLLLAALFGGLLGLTYSWIKKPQYKAQCTFVLEEEGGGALGQYSGLASMVGIDIGGGGSNGIFRGENIFELYRSRLMISKTLLSKADFGSGSQLIVDRYIAMNNLREGWKKNDELKEIDFNIPVEKFTVKHDSIITQIVKDLNKRYLTVEKLDKKLSVISVEVQSKDELFSKAFADKIVENVNAFYVQTKTKTSSENLRILERQADSVRRVLNASIGGTAAAVDANPNANPALQILRVPSQRRQIDVQANSAIYAEVLKNLEVARISLRKETPLIQVIDRPILPLEESKVGRVAGFIVGAVLVGLISIIYISFQFLLTQIKAS